MSVLDLLLYRGEKLANEGISFSNQKIRIESLKEYFNELREKVKRETQRGEEIITGRERWELTKYQGEATKNDE